MVGPYAPGGYAIASGTSFSTPLVSGQAALLLTVPGGIPALKVAAPLLSGAVTNLLITTSVNISVPNNGDPGFGRVDVSRSLGTVTNVLPTLGTPTSGLPSL
jgi:subtilisin family serine protease